MNKRLKSVKRLIAIIVFCITCYGMILVNDVYGSEDQKNVLFISSYTESFITVPEQVKGIKSILDLQHVHLDIEYMDSKRLDTNEYNSLFYQLIQYKLDNLNPYDAVIVGDDNALQFIMEYQETLFKDLPIIFLGINDFERAGLAARDQHITGLVEAASLKENIEIALAFNKEAKRVIAIVDDTLTGKGDSEQFYKIKDDFKELSFEHINVSYYTFKELEETLQKIEEDTILLYLSMFQDKTGTTITIDEAVEILKNNTKVPVYRASIGGVGEGLLGGKMVSYFEQGKLAAQMVMDIFKGVPIASIEMISESPNKYFFDYNIIEKYGIDEQLIPEDAIIINQKLTIFQQYRTIIMIVFSIIALLILVMIFIIIDNIRRRAIQKALQETNEELSALYEELTATEEELRTQYDEIQAYTEKLEKLQEKYEIAIKGTNSAVWEMNVQNETVSFSKEATLIFDTSLKESEEINQVLEKFLTPEDRAHLVREYRAVMKRTQKEIYTQVRIKSRTGSLKWVLVSGRGIADLRGNLEFINGIIIDITKLKEQEAYIEYLAYHDALTKLPNRLYFMNRLNEELDQEKQGVVMLLDLDNFKEINDLLGHAYGDMVLQKVAEKLNECSDQEIFISRFGGDEFLILIRNEVDLKVIKTYIEKINQALNTAIMLKDGEIHIHYSMGIARYPIDSKDADQLVMNADTAMYSVKNSGKNNAMFFDNAMIERLKGKAHIQTILREALKNEGFVLVYQPQVQVSTGQIVGFEALIRLKEHNIPPSVFIPIAEETGLITAIGNWVTTEAIRQLARWKSKGFNLKPIGINFSAKQLKDNRYLTFLDETLQENAIDPKYIEIEITEGILLERKEDTIDFLNQLKEIGVKIALDDFGTGYSSLSYLTFIPVDKIKLDKSLSDKFLEMENVKVMDSIISLVHSLGLQVIAEGIEDIEQYKKLKIGGCDTIQGYLFSKPLKVDEIEKVYEYNYLTMINTYLT